tara:strand:- start:258 stop:2324 length:2067 start_codon:yes stop_codon:yes gene_type:complete
MTTTQNSQSSFGTIIFTTNIPGDKEYTLNPTNISYSDEPDSKITHTTNKMYFFNEKVINNKFFSNLKKTNILSIIFNKKRFDKLAFAKDDKDNSPQLDEREIITSNIMSYIENIFTTFPKSYNIKNINNMNNMGSLKFSLPYSSIPYTYLNVDGTEHTVSRVVYYDDKHNDKTSLEMINYYNEFDKWYPNEKKLYKVFTTPLLKDFNKLFDSKMTKNNLYNTFGKNETNNQNDFNETIQKYENYIERIEKYKTASENTPSYNWEHGKLKAEFFEKVEKGNILLGVNSSIMKKINDSLVSMNATDEIKEKINIIIKKFKVLVRNNSLTIADGSLAKAKPGLHQFGGFVKDLHNDINNVKDGPEIELWVDFKEPNNNKGIKAPDKFSTVDLDAAIKESNKEILSAKEQETVFKTYNENDEGSQIIAQMLSNVSDHRFTGTIANARIDKEINDFEVAVKSIFSNYKILFDLHEKYKEPTNVTIDAFDKAYKASRVISDQLIQVKKPVGLSSSLFPSHKFKDILVLLENFIIHYDIYSKFLKKMYDPELINNKYDKHNQYKQYIDFVKNIKNFYEYKDEFELEKIQQMIRDGELVKVRKDLGFENETIRLHIDLIKGKVDDTNVKKIECEYKDNDLVERWNKLDEIKDDSVKLEYMYYFEIDDKKKDPKKVKTGGKKTRKRRRKKYIYTRKR